MEGCLKKLVLEAEAMGFWGLGKSGWKPLAVSRRKYWAGSAQLKANGFILTSRRAKKLIPVDKIHTTAESHHRIMLVEVMGRDTGWIAVQSGIAGGADVILIPEIPFSLDKICAKIQERAEVGRHFSIVVVAEGCRKIDGRPLAEVTNERRIQSRGGAVANAIGELIAQQTHQEMRVTVLGHIQRGGSPSPFDRVLSCRLGVAAVGLLARGDFGKMVYLKSAAIQSSPLEEAVGVLKTVQLDSEIVRTARALGISFGD